MNNQNETQSMRELRSQNQCDDPNIRQDPPKIQENNDRYGDFQDIEVLTRAVNIKENDCD